MLECVYIDIYIYRKQELLYRVLEIYSLNSVPSPTAAYKLWAHRMPHQWLLRSAVVSSQLNNILPGVEKTKRRLRDSKWGGRGPTSRGLERVQLKDVVVGRRGEVQRLGRGRHAVVARALEAQRAFEVQELAHEVEIGRDVGLLHLDDVVRVVHGQVELLHEVGDRHRYRAADTREAVNQNATLLSAGFV